MLLDPLLMRLLPSRLSGATGEVESRENHTQGLGPQVSLDPVVTARPLSPSSLTEDLPCVELALALLRLLLMFLLLLRATEGMGRRSPSPLGSPARSSLAPLALLLVLPLLQLLTVSSHAC